MKSIIVLALLCIFLTGCATEVSLVMEKDVLDVDEKINVRVESNNPIFISWVAGESWNVYHLVDGNWEIVPSHPQVCLLSCDQDICEGGLLMCERVTPSCQEYDSSQDYFNNFEWNQKLYKTRTVDCPGAEPEIRRCHYTELAEPGRYKVVFRYSEKCEKPDNFMDPVNDLKTLEKEFEIVG